ncbi:hypothetical protein ZOSMA_164G00380 [Zostera marina]|uniref:Peptidase metallopeptidase domain-containing protein n=1 Tax=Zostera marina TaxID=29655 RepID=A0A0K9PW27_ZOSMR|nr:hypothetical protein ZOSMA_164G00380 [Zostera marina]
MSYLVFLGFFLLASITTSSGQTCSAVNNDFTPFCAKWGCGTVKFYIDPTCPFPFYICKNIFTKAFDTWEAQTCVNFAITSVKSQANIVLQFLPIPGPHVASATAPPSPQVELTFDSGEIWAKGDTPPRPQNSLDLHSVALHLIGHAIGLRHRGNVPANKGTVMNKRLVDPDSGSVALVRIRL